ncbi:hypothetical protein N7540_000180 [Penicillium herquei]|nr:hypothetical protein N7540_000180 [Penicillium herquei]
MNNFFFDILMDIGIGKDMGVQDGQGYSYFIQFIHKYIRATTIVSNLRNFGEIFACLPEIPDAKDFRARGRELASERSAKKATQKDIFEHFLNLPPHLGVKFSQDHLTGNFVALVAAGTDTTGVATS